MNFLDIIVIIMATLIVLSVAICYVFNRKKSKSFCEYNCSCCNVSCNRKKQKDCAK